MVHSWCTRDVDTIIMLKNKTNGSRTQREGVIVNGPCYLNFNYRLEAVGSCSEEKT